MWIYAHEYRYLQIQKRTLKPLELELLVAVGHLMWVLGTELRASAGALSH